MTLIIPSDEKRIRQWVARETLPILLTLAKGKDPLGEKFSQFCDEFKELAPQVQIKKNPDEPFKTPAIIIGRHRNIAYQALPQEKELPPFLEALSSAARTAPASDHGLDSGARIDLPAELSVYIAQQCPHCPQAVSRLLQLADENPSVRLIIIDGFLFADQAAAQGIRSVPTLILDNDIRFTGQLNMTEIVNQCIQRDPAQLSAVSLRQIIEAGEAGRVATMMSTKGQIFPAFVDLLVHERWSVRLGAMVCVEYLVDESPDLAANLIAPLWERFDHLDAPVQGDVVQVLTLIKNEDAKKCLEKIASAQYDPAVREAAAEELEAWSIG